MSPGPDITPAARAQWVAARARFKVPVRRPDVDETQLSNDEIWHGIRFGDFEMPSVGREEHGLSEETSGRREVA